MHSKRRIKTMDKILIIIGLAIAVYVTAVLVAAWHGIYIPDSLTYCLLGTSTAEGIAMAAIKNVKVRYGAREDKHE